MSSPTQRRLAIGEQAMQLPLPGPGLRGMSTVFFMMSTRLFPEIDGLRWNPID